MHPLVDYFRCPEHFATLGTVDPLPADPGYFRFGDAICYGRQAVGEPSPRPDGNLVDVSQSISSSPGGASLLARDSAQLLLPFDLSEVLDNLRYERYPEARSAVERITTSSVPHAVYYFLRPALPVGVRKHLQRTQLDGDGGTSRFRAGPLTSRSRR